MRSLSRKPAELVCVSGPGEGSCCRLIYWYSEEVELIGSSGAQATVYRGLCRSELRFPFHCWPTRAMGTDLAAWQKLERDVICHLLLWDTSGYIHRHSVNKGKRNSQCWRHCTQTAHIPQPWMNDWRVRFDSGDWQQDICKGKRDRIRLTGALQSLYSQSPRAQGAPESEKERLIQLLEVDEWPI